MKKQLLFCLVLMAGTISAAFSQDIALPSLSPKASVSYTVGFMDVMVSYGSPSVRGRNIWGEVVPYDSLWTGGGDEATIVSFDRDVSLEGQNLKAGRYSLYFIPGPSTWVAVLNSNTDHPTLKNYNEALDVKRIDIQVKMNEQLQERLAYTIHIHETQADMAYIKLAWERMRLYLRFIVDTKTEAMANIMDALLQTPEEKKWKVYARGAEYLEATNGNLETALEWATKSTEIQSTSWNWYIRARIEAKRGDMQAAVASGTKSAEIGDATGDIFYKENKAEVNSAIQGWATKMN